MDNESCDSAASATAKFFTASAIASPFQIVASTPRAWDGQPDNGGCPKAYSPCQVSGTNSDACAPKLYERHVGDCQCQVNNDPSNRLTAGFCAKKRRPARDAPTLIADL